MSTPQGVIPLTQPIAHPPLVRFDKYILVRKLAEGGMAEIFLAKQVGAEGFERDVVLKLMLGHLSSSREFVEMFLDEARLAARLHHPNIVQISDLGHYQGRYFICMEYLPGEDLQSVVEVATRTGQLVPFHLASRIILNACEGLEFAHAYGEHGVPLGVVHRDVSPSNIIVTYQGTVKVLDFGIAKAGSKLTQTQPGLLKGKWGYMSPEQARGDSIDSRSDLFSLGITFHELLTGQRVFRKDNEIGVLLALMQQAIPPPSTMRPDVPPALDRIVMKALEKKPEDRYRDAGAFRADLEAYLSTISSPGISALGAYMVALFGKAQMTERMEIPSLRELSAFLGAPQELQPVPGLSPLTPSSPMVASEPFDRQGTDPTWVRKATPAAARSGPRAAAQVGRPEMPEAATIQLEVPPHVLRQQLEELRRKEAAGATRGGGRGWRWAFAALAVACVAGGAFGWAHANPGQFRALLARVTGKPPQQPMPQPPAPPQQPIALVTPPAPPDPAQPPPPDPDTPPVTPDPPQPPVAPPPPRMARPVTLTTKEVSKTLVRARPAVTSCFERNRWKGGKLEVELSIANSGAVKASRVLTSGFESGPLASCLSKTMRGLSFPRNTNNPPLTIIVPYSYSAAGP